jgi:hypothetical protein
LGYATGEAQSQGLESNQLASAYETDRETVCVPWHIHSNTKIMNSTNDSEPDWIETIEGKEWLREARSHRGRLGVIIGDWERADYCDTIDIHPLSHWVNEIFRKAHKRYPDKEVTIVIGSLIRLSDRDKAVLSAEDQHRRDQLEIAWIKTGDYRYLTEAEKITSPIVEWRSLINQFY